MQLRHLQPRCRHLPLHPAAAGFLLRHAVEVFHAAPHHRFAGRGCPRDVAQTVADLEDHGVGERADVAQPRLRQGALLYRNLLLPAGGGGILFGALFLAFRLAPAGDCLGSTGFRARALPDRDGALMPRDARLPHRDTESRHQRGGRHGAREHGNFVAADELPYTIRPAGGTRQHRAVFQVAQNVGRQVAHRLVAPPAGFLHRPHDDPVEVARQLPAQRGQCRPPPLGDFRGRGAHPRQLGRHARSFLFPDDAQKLGHARFAQRGGVKRDSARQQFVKHDPEGIHVRGGVHRAGHYVGLFRTHVLGRAHELPHFGEHGGVRPGLVHGFGDAEIDHLGDGVSVDLRNQYVGGLEIAVDYALLMGVLHGFAHRQKQPQPLLGVETMPVAIVCDGDAVHILHHEERAALFGGAGVVHAGDVGMVHQGHRLPLIGEAREHLAGVHAQLDDFQGHHAMDGSRLFGQIHGSHATFAQHPQDLVVAEVVVLESLLRSGGRTPGCTLCGGNSRIGPQGALEKAHAAQTVIVEFSATQIPEMNCPHGTSKSGTAKPLTSRSSPTPESGVPRPRIGGRPRSPPLPRGAGRDSASAGGGSPFSARLR